MSMSTDHAIRRRQGLASNTLTMAEQGDPWLSSNTATCSVHGCNDQLPLGGTTPSERRERMDKYYQHALVKHPRHSNAAASRAYFREQGI